jgi:hypothetical protein
MCFAVFGIEKMPSGVKTRRTSPSTTFHLVYSRGFMLLSSLPLPPIIPPIPPNSKRGPLDPLHRGCDPQGLVDPAEIVIGMVDRNHVAVVKTAHYPILSI